MATSNFWERRPVLVTGATGFLGRSLVSRLSDAGAAPVCLAYRSQSHPFAPSVRVVWGDVRDETTLRRVLTEYGIQSVVHLAAQAIVGAANKHPLVTLETNVVGTWCVLEACRNLPSVRQVVVASSDKAYGANPNPPFREHMPLDGRHPYDVSKACADAIAQMYAVSFGVPVVVTRCANFYGGGDLNWAA